MAVHSLKDLPTEQAAGLKVGAIPRREDPRDVWIAREDGPPTPTDAGPGTRVGTSSERRRAQILATRPDVEVASIRGNVETRLRKLDEGGYDAVIMAAAGLLRLGLQERVTSYLGPPDWLPAPGQGAVAVESRVDDPAVDELLAPIEDAAARIETTAERALLARLQGGCQIPVGALASRSGDELELQALVARPDGSALVRVSGCGLPERATQLGQKVADQLLASGGAAIVRSFREAEAERG